MLNTKSIKFLSVACLMSLLTANLYPSTDPCIAKPNNQENQKEQVTQKEQISSQKPKISENNIQSRETDSDKSLKLMAIGACIMSLISINLSAWAIISNIMTINEMKKMYNYQAAQIHGLQVVVMKIAQVLDSILRFESTRSHS